MTADDPVSDYRPLAYPRNINLCYRPLHELSTISEQAVFELNPVAQCRAPRLHSKGIFSFGELDQHRYAARLSGVRRLPPNGFETEENKAIC